MYISPSFYCLRTAYSIIQTRHHRLSTSLPPSLKQDITHSPHRFLLHSNKMSPTLCTISSFVRTRRYQLSVPGCTRLSIEGIVGMLKAYKNSLGTQGVKHLHIGGLYGVTPKHFEEIKLLLSSDSQRQEQSHTDSQLQGHSCADSQLKKLSNKPHFYCRWNLYLPCDDDRSIDIELCPRCENLRLVYDCPAEGCQGVVGHASQVCRACTLCIPRCSQCGRCINDGEYEETFCLELLCSRCSHHLSKLLGKTDGKVGLIRPSSP